MSSFPSAVKVPGSAAASPFAHAATHAAFPASIARRAFFISGFEFGGASFGDELPEFCDKSDKIYNFRRSDLYRVSHQRGSGRETNFDALV